MDAARLNVENLRGNVAAFSAVGEGGNQIEYADLKTAWCSIIALEDRGSDDMDQECTGLKTSSASALSDLEGAFIGQSHQCLGGVLKSLLAPSAVAPTSAAAPVEGEAQQPEPQEATCNMSACNTRLRKYVEAMLGRFTQLLIGDGAFLAMLNNFNDLPLISPQQQHQYWRGWITLVFELLDLHKAYDAKKLKLGSFISDQLKKDIDNGVGRTLSLKQLLGGYNALAAVVKQDEGSAKVFEAVSPKTCQTVWDWAANVFVMNLDEYFDSLWNVLKSTLVVLVEPAVGEGTVPGVEAPARPANAYTLSAPTSALLDGGSQDAGPAIAVANAKQALQVIADIGVPNGDSAPLVVALAKLKGGTVYHEIAVSIEASRLAVNVAGLVRSVHDQCALLVPSAGIEMWTAWKDRYELVLVAAIDVTKNLHGVQSKHLATANTAGTSACHELSTALSACVSACVLRTLNGAELALKASGEGVPDRYEDTLKSGRFADIARRMFRPEHDEVSQNK